MAGVLATMIAVLPGCKEESAETLEERLGKHELLTTLLPSDATVLEDVWCREATAVDNNACRLTYATAMSLEETQEYYRDIYYGRGWSRLADNFEVGPWIWRMEWRDETYKVVVTVRKPDSWPLAPITLIPQSTKTVVDLTAVER